MTPFMFVIVLATLLSVLFAWAFRTLPSARWQILASVPRSKQTDGCWTGTNFTFYGFWNANAYLLGVVILLVLLTAMDIPLWYIGVVTAPLLFICALASSLVARWVEKKKYTFTVAGAAFTGLILTPLILWAVNHFIGTHTGQHIPVLAYMGAVAIAYAFGEGLGRLACISFGCCYGKRLCDCSPKTRSLFEHICFVFDGGTKKIAYAHGWQGRRVIPIQAMTCIVYTLCGLGALWLYLSGWFKTAFILALAITHVWRAYSETLRADYRGEGKISAYQFMALASLLPGLLIAWGFPAVPGLQPDLALGLRQVWNPLLILLLQLTWFAIFVYTGRSSVTSADLHFHVRHERI